MDKGFKTDLFGFSKKEVVAYLAMQQNEHDRQKTDLQKDAAKLAERNSELDKKINDLMHQNEELASQRAALISQKDEIATALEAKEKICEELTDRINELESANASLKTALAAQIDERGNEKIEYEKLSAEKNTLENANSELAAQLREREEYIQELKKAKAELEEKLSNAQTTQKSKVDPVRAILSYVKKK